MDLNLARAHILITGATRGIGRAIAVAAAEEGANISFCARDAKAVEAMQAELKAKGVMAFGRALDVADDTALGTFISDAAQHFGQLDGVVANASALVSGASRQAFEAAFNTDLMHTRCAAEAARPYLEKSMRAAFVAISSISGSEAYGYDSVAYGTMKAALFFYVKTLAREVAPQGIRANLVSPGTTLFDGGYWDKVRQENPARFADNIAFNPMGRMATVEEIANVVVFLLSPRASFVSGENITVDGTATQRIPG
ncbi:MAG: SDR family oxidoreductase [Hyphomicrobiales bacterium]